MRAVVQRVSRAHVEVDGAIIGQISSGVMVLLGVGQNDRESDARYLAEKIAGLRIFEDHEGKMNRSLSDEQGGCLVVSQFTLYGDCRKGRRPGFTDAAPPEQAERLYEYFADQVRGLGIEVATGKFRAQMRVELVNEGPVTLLLDSERAF